MTTIEITKETENKLLGRRELEFMLPGKLTPSRKETRAALAKQLDIPESRIVIDSIIQRTGSNITIGKAKVYDSEETLKRVTLVHKLTRGEKKKEQPTGQSSPSPEKK